MQPTYLPWCGYFSLINKVDLFIFLDDVQISPKSFMLQNKILIEGKEKWIKLSYDKSCDMEHRYLNNTLVLDKERILNSHLREIQRGYLESKFFLEIQQIMYKSMEKSNFVSDLNSSIIIDLSKSLEINTKFMFASDFKLGLKGSQKLIELLTIVQAEKYICVPGSLAYMQSENCWVNKRFTIEVFDYYERPYKQFYTEKFVPKLSILDIILSEGFKNTSSYIKSH